MASNLLEMDQLDGKLTLSLREGDLPFWRSPDEIQTTSKRIGMINKNLRALLALASISILSTGLVRAEFRTFSNNEGSSIKAELVGVHENYATLRSSNGGISKFPISSLSEKDQAYVKAWNEENKTRVATGDLRLAIKKSSQPVENSKAKNKKQNSKKGKDSERATETTYQCVLQNYSTRSLDGLSANYTIYKRVISRGKDGTDISIDETTESSAIGALPARGRIAFETDSVIAKDVEKKSKKGPSTSQSETIVGMVMELLIGDRVVLIQSHPANFKSSLDEEAKRREARDKEDAVRQAKRDKEYAHREDSQARSREARAKEQAERERAKAMEEARRQEARDRSGE